MINGCQLYEADLIKVVDFIYDHMITHVTFILNRGHSETETQQNVYDRYSDPSSTEKKKII